MAMGHQSFVNLTSSTLQVDTLSDGFQMDRITTSTMRTFYPKKAILSMASMVNFKSFRNRTIRQDIGATVGSNNWLFISRIMPSSKLPIAPGSWCTYPGPTCVRSARLIDLFPESLGKWLFRLRFYYVAYWSVWVNVTRQIPALIMTPTELASTDRIWTRRDTACSHMLLPLKPRRRKPTAACSGNRRSVASLAVSL